MDIDFPRLRGPKPSIHENFELLVGQLLHQEMGAISMNGSGGDGGIDSLVINNQGQFEVFQVKYFPGTLSQAQKKQVKESLDTVLANHKVSKWILVIPHDHTPAEKKWFESLHDVLPLEWWGMTVLRNLIAKHPLIAKQFFGEATILQKLDSIRSEITNLSRVMKGDGPVKQGMANDDIPAVLDYFDRAKEVCQVIDEDAGLFDGPGSPIVAIDAYDIIYFAGMDSRFAVSESVADFCFNHSPVPFTVLDASKIELLGFLAHLRSKSKEHTAEETTAGRESIIATFLYEYSRNPESSRTKNLFQQLAGNNLEGFIAVNGLKKLQASLRTGSLRLSDHETTDDKKVGEIYDVMLHECKLHLHSLNDLERYQFLENLYRDANNLAYIDSQWNNSKHAARMISSAPFFGRVSRKIFNGLGPVRSLHQYGYFLHATRGRHADFMEIPETIESLKNLVVHAYSVSGSNTGDMENMAMPLEKFLSFYRHALRPVDMMIVEGYSKSGQLWAKGMHEFYQFLTRENNLIKAFENWLEYITSTLASLEASISKQGQVEALTLQIEEQVQKYLK